MSTLSLLGLSVAVSLLTFAGEAVGIGIAFHVSPLRVLDTVFDFDAGIRPGWQVLAAGTCGLSSSMPCARKMEQTGPRAKSA